jgi:hypothetical protein
MSKILSIGLLWVLCAASSFADPVYLRVGLYQLTLSGGKRPGVVTDQWTLRNKVAALAPYAVLDGAGEDFAAAPRRGETRQLQEFDLLICIPEQREVKGKLFMPKEDLSGMVALGFTVSGGAA